MDKLKDTNSKLNQLIYLCNMSKLIESCSIYAEKEIIKIYFGSNSMEETILCNEFSFVEVDEAIKNLKDIIEMEVNNSHKLGNTLENVSNNVKNFK